MKEKNSIAPLLKKWRGSGKGGRGDFTQQEAAAHLGIPLNTYQDYEYGRTKPSAMGMAGLLVLLRRKPKHRKKGKR